MAGWTCHVTSPARRRRRGSKPGTGCSGRRWPRGNEDLMPKRQEKKDITELETTIIEVVVPLLVQETIEIAEMIEEMTAETIEIEGTATEAETIGIEGTEDNKDLETTGNRSFDD